MQDYIVRGRFQIVAALGEKALAFKTLYDREPEIEIAGTFRTRDGESAYLSVGHKIEHEDIKPPYINAYCHTGEAPNGWERIDIKPYDPLNKGEWPRFWMK